MQSFDRCKVQFEMLLYEAVEVCGSLQSRAGQTDMFLTDYTQEAENKTQALTGISINRQITQAQKNALEKPRPVPVGKLPVIYDITRSINQKADALARTLIDLQNKVLDEVLDGKMFTYSYPSAYIHMNGEAGEYLKGLERLSMNTQVNTGECAVQKYWDGNMGQHAASLRGLLDPSEKAMFKKADNFASAYAALEKETEQACGSGGDFAAESDAYTKKAAELTDGFKTYKTELTKAVLGNRIKSVILPLYADHQLREANYYLKLLNNEY